MPDDDLTPPDGTEFDERPTDPQLPTVTCPACRGQRRILRTVEAGTGYRSIMKQCDVCGAAGMLTTEQYEAWARGHRR